MRRRMLNPSFFVDPDIVGSLDFAGRFLYQGLWCAAEDSGVFELSPLALKMKIFPGDPVNLEQIEKYIATLVETDKVVPFEADGKKYGWLKNFDKHQKLDRPSPPTLPLPPWVKFNQEGDKRHQWYYSSDYDEENDHSRRVVDTSPTRPRHVVGEAAPEEKGREEKRKEEKGTVVDDTSPPPPPPQSSDSEISDYEHDIMSELHRVEHYPADKEKDLNVIRSLEDEYPSVDLLLEARKWRTYKLDKPLIPKKSNPRSQFRTWVQKAEKWQKERDEKHENSEPDYIPPYWQKYVPPDEGDG